MNPVKNDRVDANIFYNAIFYSIHPIQIQALTELLWHFLHQYAKAAKMTFEEYT